MDSGRRRWIVVALLFAATTINYIDRQTLSVLGPTLRHDLGLSETDYANVVTAFLIPYTVMYALGGRIMDRLGARIGLALSLAWWSIATALTGLARGAVSLALFRGLLGAGEPCVYPAGVKACAQLFEVKQRALATGIFSSGSAVGAILAPPLVAWCTLRFGWRYTFVIPGLLGLCWLPLWWWSYRDRAAGKAGQPGAKNPPWRELLRLRTVWGLVLPRFASDPVWYFYLFWVPDYLQRERHLSLAEFAIYGWIPFLFADLGNVSGGALSDWLIRRGWTPQAARVRTLVGVASIAPLGALVGFAPNMATALAVVCVVAFLTQCWSTNMATLASEILPETATGTAVGMMGTAGSLGGALFSQVLGFLISHLGYASAFVAGACMHPIAATVLVLLLRRPDRSQPAC